MRGAHRGRLSLRGGARRGDLALNADLAGGIAVFALPAAAALLYLGRVAVRGRAGEARVERDGGSPVLSKAVMEAFYWTLRPFVRIAMILRVGANAITLVSLGLAFAGGAVIATGHLGVGTFLAAIGAAGDALDGLVAKAAGTAGDAGEVLDAACDRYSEIALLGGLAVWLRSELPALLLALGALAASFMVSYSTAKAEALGVEPPRGAMRRSERAVLFFVGCALEPMLGRIPVLIAIGAIALFGNWSAIRRLYLTASLVKR